MPHPTRRTLLAAAPALAAGGGTAHAAASEVEAAYVAYLPFAPGTSPRERDFLIVDIADDEIPLFSDVDYDAFYPAQHAWLDGRQGALQRLTDARARSLADLESKLQVVVEDLPDGEALDMAEELLLSCLRDVRAMREGKSGSSRQEA